jgi:hypothetical protein
MTNKEFRFPLWSNREPVKFSIAYKKFAHNTWESILCSHTSLKSEQSNLYLTVKNHMKWEELNVRTHKSIDVLEAQINLKSMVHNLRKHNTARNTP